MDVYTEFWGYENYDLKKEYYLLLAWGPVYESRFTLILRINLRDTSTFIGLKSQQ